MIINVSLRNIRLIWLFAILITGISPVPVAGQNTSFHIPVYDWNDRTDLHVVVDRQPGQYLGHPTTVLLEDGHTILCVYPKGHGRGPIVLKKSLNGGLTWSERLPTPTSWETSRETPTIHRVVDAAGQKKLILFSGLFPVRMAVSDDNGQTWSELEPVGAWGGIVAMASVIERKTGPGHYLALFHDDGRYFRADGQAHGVFTLYQTQSYDGGRSWSEPTAIFQSGDVHLCEPGAFRSPDGKQIAVLLRENRRLKNSHVMFSDDEGATWSEPREVHSALTGDRHVARYAPDGRLVVSFRDYPPQGAVSPTAGDWVGWVGRYEDIFAGKPGECRIRFKDNHHGWDCAYSGLELLPDGTFVATTYGYWTPGEQPYILAVRFKMDDIGQR